MEHTSVRIKYLMYEMTFLIPTRSGLHIQSILSFSSVSGPRAVRKIGKGCLTSVFSNEMVLTAWRDVISLLSKLLRHDPDDHTDSQSLTDDMSDASSFQNLPT